MRRPNPQPRDQRKVPIPEELRESFRGVQEILEEAKTDPDIPIDYGDAIQVDAVCGGRIGSEPRPFKFTYYPKGDTRHGRWFLSLHPLEIEDIADGFMKEISLYCCTSPDCRCKFSDEDNLCFFCDYEDENENAARK